MKNITKKLLHLRSSIKFQIYVCMCCTAIKKNKKAQSLKNFRILLILNHVCVYIHIYDIHNIYIYYIYIHIYDIHNIYIYYIYIHIYDIHNIYIYYIYIYI